MRDFFKQELNRLHLTTGLQQGFKLTDQEVTDLLDILCAECAKFPLIPEKDKQIYIQEFMKTDPEFIGFNKRVIWKWLNIANRKHLPKDQSQFTEIPWVPPTQEQQEKINAMLQQWGKDLMGQSPDFSNIEKDIEAIKQEDKERQEGKKGSGYKMDKEKIVKRELHDLWIRENFNLDGSKKECWTSEDEWLELQADSPVEPQKQ